VCASASVGAICVPWGANEKRGPGTPENAWTSTGRNRGSSVNADGDRRGAVDAPVLSQDRPEQLVVIFAAPEERPAEHALLYRAELAQRAVAAAVGHGRPGFDAMGADGVEDEVEH